MYTLACSAVLDLLHLGLGLLDLSRVDSRGLPNERVVIAASRDARVVRIIFKPACIERPMQTRSSVENSVCPSTSPSVKSVHCEENGKRC